MAKFLLVLFVVLAVGWWLFGRKRGGDGPLQKRPPPAGEPAPMIACVRCGVHVPGAEAHRDAAGRPFCGEAHRALGPR